MSLKVEVKGTTSANPSAIFMTRNEVNLHKKEKGDMALVIVSSIRLLLQPNIQALDGVIEVLIGWDINEWSLTPTTYRVER